MAGKKIFKPLAAVLCIIVLAGVIVWQRNKQQGAINGDMVTDYTSEKGGEEKRVDGEGADINQLQMVSYPARKEEQELDSAYLANLKEFYKSSIRDTLTSENGENRVYSPVNLYLCMAMLTEMTDGKTKEQLMDALGQTEDEKVREQSRKIWEKVYMDDGIAKCILGDSIWLNQEIPFEKDVLKSLAENYYTETFQGKMGSEMDQRIQKWINDMTGNKLKEEAGGIKTDARTVFMLLSTAYFYDQWVTPFQENDTKEDVFTNADGEKVSCNFMNSQQFGNAYQTEHFQATVLEFENGNSMLLVLPEKGVTAEDLLKKDMEEILHLSADHGDAFAYGEVTLSLPKFEISSNLDLIPVMKNMGVTDLFETEDADFTKLLGEESREKYPVFINKVQQASKAAVDENGCSVASFTEVELRMGSAMSTEKFVIDCDHPFLFIISNYDGIPVFAGVVNQMEK